jgi:hypothetical protein
MPVPRTTGQTRIRRGATLLLVKIVLVLSPYWPRAGALQVRLAREIPVYEDKPSTKEMAM